MKPEEIKTRLRDEMADLAPDRLEDLLAACDAAKTRNLILAPEFHGGTLTVWVEFPRQETG